MTPRFSVAVVAVGLPLALAACDATGDRDPLGPSKVSLGKLVWLTGTPNDTRAAASDTKLVRNIQSGLHRLGYDPGAVDGRAGPRTGDAIRRYQRDNGLVADGRPSPALWAQIHSKLSG
jgi:peptidoglycan hydrolase-like protein with peptidoglycan-binding domain